MFNNDIINLDKEFNQLLILYTKNYKLLIQELENNNKYNDVISKYANKNVNYNGDKYYINNYGFAHKYEDENSWTNRSNSCSLNPINIDADEFNKLKESVNMGIGQECGVAGFNIENKSNSERAWVDIEGRKHVYSDEIWNNKNKTCESRITKVLSENLYNNIPEFNKMTNTSTCNNINVDPKILNNISYLNNKLLNLAKKILEDIEILSKKDISLKYKLDKIKTNISNHVSNLENDKTHLDNNQYNIELQNKLDDSKLDVNSRYTIYIIWCIICTALLIITYYTFISNKVSFTVIGIICILLLYVIYNEIVPRVSKLQITTNN